MSDAPEYYNWHGVPIEVEVWDATDGNAWDFPEELGHPTGRVPEGERHYLCRILTTDKRREFWATEEAFAEHADPLMSDGVGFDGGDNTDEEFQLYGEPAEVDAVVYVNGKKYLLADNGDRNEAVELRGEEYDTGSEHTEYVISDE